MPEDKRYLFISDIHGQFVVLEHLLAILRYTPGHDRLIFLGDYISAMGDNLGTLQYLHRLSQDEGVWVVLGNHDVALQEQIRRLRRKGFQPDASHELAPWTDSGMFEYTHEIARAIVDHEGPLEPWLMALPWWYEDAHFIGVHAAINERLDDWRDTSLTYLTCGREPFLSCKLKIPQTVVFGHTPCNQLHSSCDPWFGPGKIGIDGGAGHGYQLNGLVFEDAYFSWQKICLNHGLGTRMR